MFKNTKKVFIAKFAMDGNMDPKVLDMVWEQEHSAWIKENDLEIRQM